MAYVLGFMFADGSLLDTNKSSRTYYLNFCNNDYDLLNDIRVELGSDHRIYMRPPRLMTHRGGRYVSKVNYVLRFGNKVMYQDLLNLGMLHRKSNVMHLPDVPDEYFSYFLRGYFDGDGCINFYIKPGQTTNRLSVIFTSGSTAFLSEIAQKIAILLKIEPPKYYKSLGAYNLLTKGVSAIKILDYIYANPDLVPYLKRKYLKYLDYRNNLMGPRVKKALALSLG